MKSISVTLMKELDRKAIEEYKIPSIILMENAGIRTAGIIYEVYGQTLKKKSILIVCGRGNNGGDGFVIARHLMNKGYIINVVVLTDKNKIKGDPQVNLTIFERMGGSVIFTGSKQPDEKIKNLISESNLIVDAIFGTGLDRNVAEPIKAYISIINQSQKPIVSVDAPSGLHCDTGAVLGIAIKAHVTVTMAVAKKGFFINEGPHYTGKVYVVDISIPKKLIDEVSCEP